MADATNPKDYTVQQLKDFLRVRGLPTTGNKADLMLRLEESSPNVWNELRQEPGARDFVEAESEAARTEIQQDTTSREENLAADRERHEFEFIRRERDLLRREVELLKREAELGARTPDSNHRSSIASDSGINVIKGLKDLLSEFDGTGNEFQKWKQQVELLRGTHNLDDNATRVLISSRLKGKALNWFHSKPDHIVLSATSILEEMKRMFDHRPSKLALRKEFEQRIWRVGEAFSEYYHDKVILANRIPIEMDEIIDYVIDGVPDTRLRDQARLQRFKEASEMIEAFETITLKNNSKPERSTFGANQQKFKKEVKSSTTEQAETNPSSKGAMKCYNCKEKGHRAADCPKPRGSASEPASKRANNPTEKSSSASTEMNLIQPFVSVEPYTIPVSYSVPDDQGNVREYSFAAIVDTGSPISLIKPEYAPVNCRIPVAEKDYQFNGVNNSRIEILDIFEKDVKVNNIDIRVKFFVVPHKTMSGAALLGRDFTSNSTVKVVIDQAFELLHNKANELTKTDDFVDQIMHIDCVDQSAEKVDLNISPNVCPDIAKDLKSLYNNVYLTSKELDSPVSEPEMTICLKHEQPISFRARRLAHSDKTKLSVILDDLVKEGTIRESASPYASPIVLVRKKNGNLRLCIDYRELNKVTIKDNFPTPMIDDHLDRLKNKKIYSSLDLKNGFHHIRMAESSIKYTAFITPMGQFEYLKMPFGLTNAPRVFQRYIHNIFRSMITENKILIYMDDILVATEGIEEHFNILREVFEIAQQHKLRFREDKCFFLYNEITYLGYLINENGIQPSVENVESIIHYPIPRNVKEVQRFIGLASYFRRFIPKFSVKAKPLYDLLKKNAEFRFGKEENEAYEALKTYLANKPILAIYCPAAATELHCDASANGFGAILLQKQDGGHFRPISYFSHRTTPAESRYHSYELECLAVIYAVKRFHVYLLGIKFKIVTDCDSFRLTLSKQTINPRIARWAMFLQQYDYEIIHRPGKRMEHVDALSRCSSILILEGNTFEQVLSLKQNQDQEICKIRDKLERSEDKLYELRDGLVYRKINKHRLLFYVPEVMENNVIRTCHDDLGHVGIKKVITNIMQVYWFPKMQEKVKNYIANCLKCIEFSTPSGKSEGYLYSIPKGNLPFQTYHIDHYGPLEKTGKGHKYILSIIDAFTKFSRLYPCKSTTSAEAVKHLKEHFRCYSKPHRLISDRGSSFTSDEFKNFMEEESIKHVLIAVGTPRANGQIERLHRVITPMLAKLSDPPKKWDQAISLVEFALNNTVCRSIGNTPSQLLFGIDQLGQVNDNLRLHLDSQTNESRDLEKLREAASLEIVKNQTANKESYDRAHKKATIYNVDDYVVIANTDTTAGVNKKLIPKYKGPYVVSKVLDSDRYVISDVPGFQLTQIPYTGIVSADRMKHWVRE